MSNSHLSTISPGDVFGRWTIIDTLRHGGRKAAKCVCACGAEKVIRVAKLLDGTSRSCGCFRADKQMTHGMTAGPVREKSREYWVWNSMLRRCSNPRDRGFKNYGARGITVADSWQKFENFYADMGPRPGPQYSLERKDNNKGYGPENCVWATRMEQARNKRNTRRITVNGETKCLKDWADRIGVNHATIIARIDAGWPIEQAITLPKGSQYKRRVVSTT